MIFTNQFWGNHYFWKHLLLLPRRFFKRLNLRYALGKVETETIEWKAFGFPRILLLWSSKVAAKLGSCLNLQLRFSSSICKSRSGVTGYEAKYDIIMYIYIYLYVKE